MTTNKQMVGNMETQKLMDPATKAAFRTASSRFDYKLYGDGREQWQEMSKERRARIVSKLCGKLDELCSELNLDEKRSAFAHDFVNRRLYPVTGQFDPITAIKTMLGLLMLADIREGDDLHYLPWDFDGPIKNGERHLSLIRERGLGGLFLFAARTDPDHWDAYGGNPYWYAYRYSLPDFDPDSRHDFVGNSALGEVLFSGIIAGQRLGLPDSTSEVIMGIMEGLPERDWSTFFHAFKHVDNMMGDALWEADNEIRMATQKRARIDISAIFDAGFAHALRNRHSIFEEVVERFIKYATACNKDNLDAEFPFKPSSLASEVFRNFARLAKNANLWAFSMAKTLRQFQEFLVRAPKVFEEDMSIPEEIIAERMDGLFVDVVGTLIAYNRSNKGQLNKELYERMLEASNAGRRVVVFTEGSTDNVTEDLRQYGVDECFLPVRFKPDFNGKLLEEVYDDRPPTYFLAVKYHQIAEKQDKKQ